MQSKPPIVLCLLLGTIVSTGCSKQESSPGAGAPTPTAEASAAAPAAAPARHASACDLVTGAEMSAILGGTVQTSAGGNERPPAATECIYQSPTATTSRSGLDESASAGPYAEIEVDWGGGDPAVLDRSAELANGAATMDAANPLKGLGDRAYKVTADQVFISTHGNLMMIRFARRSGDVAVKARKIFEIAQPRM
jgi:hypothetical protein